MKVFKKMKDGGPLSKVWGYWVIEAKWGFSIVILRFLDGSREAYHSHAFNAVSWLLRGKLVEKTLRTDGAPEWSRTYRPSWWPIYTPRSCFHKVTSVGTSWVISFRGPWADKWEEYISDSAAASGNFITLTHGRKVVTQ